MKYGQGGGINMTKMCTDTFNWQQYCLVSYWASGAVAGSMLLGSSSIASILVI